MIGYLEPHDRPETTALAEGLETVPRLRAQHGTLELEEMDLDAVLARAPQLALIDELAHTNAAGMRNEKRWQDIEEVLDAGIDVISTVNVQHLESLNDAIFELTEIRVRETFPDGVLDEADEVVLVDLSPEELQERLRAGKVYPKERAAVALENFFRADKLGALRELTLREVAEDVEARRIARPLEPLSKTAVAERVLALVEPQPKSQRILRRAWRSAQRFGTDMDALWVRPTGRPPTEEEATQLAALRRHGRHPRRALPRGRGRRPRRHGAAGRRPARLDLHLRRHSRRVPPPRDLRRLASLAHGPRAPRPRHPGHRQQGRQGPAEGMIAAVVALAALALVLAGALVARSGFRLRKPHAGARRVLVPFTGGTLDPTVLDAAIRLASAENATLVPAYLLLVPLRYAEDSPLRDEVAVALPLLEAVEHAALRAGVPVDARIEKGRSPTHALQRLWDVERFDRILAPAPNGRSGGFTSKDVTWILAHAPSETIVLKPDPNGAQQAA